MHVELPFLRRADHEAFGLFDETLCSLADGFGIRLVMENTAVLADPRDYDPSNGEGLKRPITIWLSNGADRSELDYGMLFNVFTENGVAALVRILDVSVAVLEPPERWRRSIAGIGRSIHETKEQLAAQSFSFGFTDPKAFYGTLGTLKIKATGTIKP